MRPCLRWPWPISTCSKPAASWPAPWTPLPRSRELERRVNSLGAGLAPQIEVERVRATREDFEQQAASANQDWRFNSAALTRVLRLDPAAVAVPLEPPHLQVTLIPPKATVDELIPVALTNRPELESQQAVVQATLVRLRQERMRPLIPSLVLQSNAVPNDNLGAGVYGSGSNSLNSWSGRSDWNAQVVWELKNLGFGNRGLVTQRLGQQRQELAGAVPYSGSRRGGGHASARPGQGRGHAGDPSRGRAEGGHLVLRRQPERTESRQSGPGNCSNW